MTAAHPPLWDPATPRNQDGWRTRNPRDRGTQAAGMSASDADSSTFLHARAAPAPHYIAISGKVDRFLVDVLTWGLFITIFIQKLALAEFEVVWFVVIAMMGVLLYYGRLRISTHRLVLYLVTMGLACFSEAFATDGTLTSLVLTMMVCLPCVAVVDASAETRLAFLQRVQLLGLIVGGFVAMDLVVQVLGLRMPSLESFMPEGTVYHNYVYIQPLFWRSPYDKPNGLVFLEASYVSQFLAITLIVEMAYFRRVKYIVAYGLALMGISAGTGIVMVLLTLPFVIRYYLTPRMVAIGLTLGLVIGGVAVETGFIDRAAQRSAEFDQQGRSGNARFVAPFTSFAAQFTTAPTSELLWGYGAGTQSKSTDIMLIPPTKMILEFGLATFIAYMIFAFVFIFEASRSFFALTWAVMLDFMFINGGTVQPITSAIGILLVSIWAPRREPVAIRNATLDPAEPDRAAISGPLFK